MHQPEFPHASALIEGPLEHLILAGGGRRKHFGHPVGGAAHTAPVELGGIAHHQRVRLDHGFHFLVGLAGLGEAHVDWGDEGAARLPGQMIGHLARHLSRDILMCQIRCRPHQVGLAVDQLIAPVLRPAQVLTVGMTRMIAKRQTHADLRRLKRLGILALAGSRVAVRAWGHDCAGA
jgi:hypothetical protein